MRSAGRTRCARRTSGPNRSPRTGAAPATAQSCTGRRASRTRAQMRNQFHHVIDVAPTILGGGWPARAASVNGIAQAPLEGVSMLPTLRNGEAPENPRGAVLRDDGQPRHLPPGLDGGDQAPHAVEGRHSRRRSTTTSGSCTVPTTGPRPTTCRRRTRRNWLSCNGFGSSRRSSTTWCRSMIAASSGSIPISPDAPADPRQHANCCSPGCG